jgi:Protein of unknown function (DUF1553)/Protein of unknown function (DUF1549)/Planctomycete cytochrome C
MAACNRQVRCRLFYFLLFSSLLVSWSSFPLFGQDISFNRDIRPILAKHCLACHGPDENARQADLRLDLRDSAFAIRDDHAAIVANSPDKSELMERVTSKDSDTVMPPPQAGPPLSANQIEMIRRWIADGASYEKHWAFVAPVRPNLPKVNQASWVKQPIDYFVLSKLEQAQLLPSPNASKPNWLRRVYLDLVGLPPTPEEVEHFCNSNAPQAYERVVDHLLAWPEFGEKWGRAWLDLARYSDTNGYEKDRPRSIWPYRDWVIEAINDDMPFTDFTVQQLAGDMLSPSDPKAIIATGMQRNTMLNEEGGIDPLEFRFYAMNDRVATTGLVWLGLTVGCAQCHSHKFDPISHQEYYQFMALFNNADEPDYAVSSPDQQSRQAAQERRLNQLVASLPDHFPVPTKSPSQSDNEADLTPTEAFDHAFQGWSDELHGRAIDWKVAAPSEMKSNMPRLEVLDDGSVFSTGDITKRDVFELTIQPSVVGGQPITALRLEVMPDPRLPAGGPGRCYYEGRRGDFFLSEVDLKVGDQAIKVRDASHSYGKNGLGSGSADAKNVFDGDGSTGWSTADREGQAHQLVLVLDQPLKLEEPLRIDMLFERHYATSLGRFRWSVTTSDQPAMAQDLSAEMQTWLLKPPSNWSEQERLALRRQFAMTCKELEPARKEVEKLRTQLAQSITTLVMQERPADNPRPTHRHHRGEYLSPREPVDGSIPEIFLPGTKQPPKNRLETARWLASRENPLVARVYVNRVWQSFFGDGLVRSQGDFGTQSSPPTHPQLLDWLAVDWMDCGWSLKQLCRTIALSATYRQDSKLTPELLQRDPENLLLARVSRQRVDAEVVRDAILTASGLLCRDIGGESVRPPQPASVTALAYGGGAWPESLGGARYRRSLYTYSKRTAPFAAYMAFDAPSGETCAVRRDRSNTPLQALTLLNDRMFLELSESLGVDVLSEANDDRTRAKRIAYRIWTREPNDPEIEAIVQFVDLQRQRIRAGEIQPEIQSNEVRIKKLVTEDPMVFAWMLAARAVMNTDEAIVKP